MKMYTQKEINISIFLVLLLALVSIAAILIAGGIL